MLRRILDTIAKMAEPRSSETMFVAAGIGTPLCLVAPTPCHSESVGRCDPPVSPPRSGSQSAPGSAFSLLGPVAVERRVIVLAPSGSPLQRHVAWIADATLGCVFSDDADAVHEALDRSAGGSILIVDLAVFRCPSTAFAWLGRLREDVPGVVVTAASDRFAEHEMGCDRFLVADTSVKLPVTRPALALAVSAAMTNHAFTMPVRRASAQH
jgi:hypothetical protein